jgi:serine/threonine-protein kinase
MTTTDTLINRTFDKRYVIRRKLGSGGMADVYLAEDQELGRRVALKLLNDRHAADDQFVERFRREAQSAAGLSHPNIVSIFDRGLAEGTYYIAMEFLDGRTLKELLIRNGPTPIPIAIDYARQILGALSFAHRNGIIHRDIKPHNIVVGSDGRLKVTDFGIARSGASQMTEAGSIVGTAQYLSPEQARGARVDPRSDLYSLGIVLYEMLTGRVPFTGDTAVEIAMKHLSEVPEPPSKLRPEVPHDLDAVVMRALAKEPERRYGSAEEMDADLARVARGVAVSRETENAMTQVLAGAGVATAATVVTRPRAVAPPPAPPIYRPPTPYYDYEEPPRGRSIWPWLLALGLIIAGGIGGWFLYTKIQEQLDNNRPVAVPDVTLLQQDLAVLQIRQAGLNPVVVKAPDESVPPGQVISENPGGGSKVGKGSTVTLQVSTGKPKVTVPDVRGRPVTDAITALAGLGLNPHIVHVYSPQPADTVTGQFPSPGDRIVKGSSVRINVSRGAKPVSVPDVTGQPYLNAKSALEGQGFRVLRTEVQSDQAQGVVVGEDPPPGQQVSKGSTITLSVSKGPATTQIPDVRGQNQATAQSLLAQSGLTPSVVFEPVNDPSQDGIVLDENPAPGADAKAGEIVIITVGQIQNGTPGGDGTTTGTTTTGTTTTSTTTTTTPATGATPATP